MSLLLCHLAGNPRLAISLANLRHIPQLTLAAHRRAKISHVLGKFFQDIVDCGEPGWIESRLRVRHHHEQSENDQRHDDQHR